MKSDWERKKMRVSEKRDSWESVWSENMGKGVVLYHVYMYIVSALDFGWFGFNVLVFFK